jgi:hypothetical protein
MTYTMRLVEHLWDVSVPKRVHLSNLVTCYIDSLHAVIFQENESSHFIKTTDIFQVTHIELSVFCPNITVIKSKSGTLKYKYINICCMIPVQWLKEMIPRDIHWVPQDVLFEEVESMSSSLWMWCQAAQHPHVWHKQQRWQQVSTPTYKLGQRRLWQKKQNTTVISWLGSISLHKEHLTNTWESCKSNPEADSLVGI